METFPTDSAVVASGGERSTTEKPATDDATLLEKTQKAMKQGGSSSSLFFFFALAHGKIYSRVLLRRRQPSIRQVRRFLSLYFHNIDDLQQIHVDSIFKRPRTLDSYPYCSLIQAHAGVQFTRC